jgi:site-specific DNA recombinase
MKERLIKNVVSYLRVSTQEQVYGYSIENQRREIQEYCNQKGYNLIREYADLGKSGTAISGREDFQKLLADVEKEDIDSIVIWKLSRISRNLKDLLNVVDFIERNGTSLSVVENDICTKNNMGMFFIKVAGMISEMERDNIVAQSKGGMKTRALEGRWNGGKTPMGYDNFSDDKGLIINEKEAETVKLIFHLYTNSDWGYAKICKFLNDNIDKYSTKLGKEWAFSTIRQVLDNPTYAGLLRWGLREDWNKKRRKGITDNYVQVKGKHDAIIESELWERTKDKRKLVGKTNEKIYDYKHLLSGLLKCPGCGSSMVANRTSRVNKKTNERIHYRYYVCSKWNSHRGECRPNSIKADIIEQQVVGGIKEFLNTKNVAKEIAERASKAIDVKELDLQVKDYKKKIRKCEEGIDNYLSFLADRNKVKMIGGEEKLVRNVEQLNNSKADLEKELRTVTNQRDSVINNKLNLENIALILERFEVLFDRMNHEERKEMLNNLIKEIRINDSEDIEERLVKEIVLNIDNNTIKFMKKGEDVIEEKTFGYCEEWGTIS